MTGSRQVGDAWLADPINEWRAHRVTWAFLFVIVCLAAYGAAGDSSLSRRTVMSGAGEHVAYSPVLRLTVPADLTIAGTGERRTVATITLRTRESMWFSVTASPSPLSETSGADGITYRLAVSDSSGYRAQFVLTPRSVGIHALHVATPSGSTVELRFLVLP